MCIREWCKVGGATGKVTQLTNDPAAEEHAVQFSPDDEWLTVDTNKHLPETPDRPGQLNLWKVRADGSDYTPLTRYAFPVFGGLWSDDGTWISYITNEDLSNLKNRDGYIVRSDGTGAKKIFSVRPGSQDTLADWHPDGRRIAATSDASGQNRAGTVDIETGAVRWYSPEGIEEHALRFSKNGKWLVTIRNEESQVRPILYDVERWRRYRTWLLLPATVFAMTAIFTTLLKPASGGAFGYAVISAGLALVAVSLWTRQRFSYLAREGDGLVVRSMAANHTLTAGDIERARVVRLSSVFGRPERRGLLPRPAERWLAVEAISVRLRDGVDPQTYAIGIKDVWEAMPSRHQPARLANLPRVPPAALRGRPGPLVGGHRDRVRGEHQPGPLPV